VKKLATTLATHFLMRSYLGNIVFSFVSITFSGSGAVSECWPQVSTYGATLFCTSLSGCGATLSRNQS